MPTAKAIKREQYPKTDKSFLPQMDETSNRPSQHPMNEKNRQFGAAAKQLKTSFKAIKLTNQDLNTSNSSISKHDIC